MKGYVFNTDAEMYVKDFDAPLYKSLGKEVGGYIEIVHPKGLPEPLCFVCNEEGLLHGLPLNAFASVLYGTLDHGHPIVGNIVIMREGFVDGEPDLVGLTDEDMCKIESMAADISGGRIKVRKTEN